MSENQTVRKTNMLDNNTENVLIQLAQKIDARNEVERNKLEQKKLDSKKPNPEYLRVMGYLS